MWSEDKPTGANGVETVAERIEAGESPGKMSCGEQIAAALLYNRPDWLPSAYTHPLDAIDRLGSTWLGMALELHRDGVACRENDQANRLKAIAAALADIQENVSHLGRGLDSPFCELEDAIGLIRSVARKVQ